MAKDLGQVLPNLKIGTVTTLTAGSNATASIGGTPTNPTLNLGIPRGATGAKGATGATGAKGSDADVSDLIKSVVASVPLTGLSTTTPKVVRPSITTPAGYTPLFAFYSTASNPLIPMKSFSTYNDGVGYDFTLLSPSASVTSATAWFIGFFIKSEAYTG